AEPKPERRPRRGEGRGRGRQDRPARGGEVVGMGDHVPAFLLRSVRTTASGQSEAAEDDDDSESSSQAA
ncbi:MAG TPA: DEAD/DEAH box helicase, partial [Thermohalobaculum sp.]|nr:DEAD/DEAH box helicase [Thermohalobaculum sp.]